MFSKIVEQSIKNGFFDEVNEDVLNDEEQFNTMVDVFMDEIINSELFVQEIKDITHPQKLA
jgi:hypothetical protein